MKRIDDKIKEIEKKDKTNRILFIALVVVFAAGYVYLTQQTIKEQKGTISEQEGTIAEQLETEKALTKQLEDSIEVLNSSLKPDEYWKHIKDENTHEAYLGFIMNDWGIDKEEFIPDAIKQLKSSSPKGFKGWIWVGSKRNDGTYASSEVVEIIFREGEEDYDPNSEPKIGDVVRLKTTNNRNTYSRRDATNANELGWRNKTKAFVADVYKVPGTTNFNILIKYY